MKYDFSKKLTIGATRTLNTLQHAMLSLLMQKSFEDIVVSDLCEKAMLPRATFYNYFDDKYDLLEYCLIGARKILDIGYEKAVPCDKRMDALIENCFGFISKNVETVEKVLANNPPNRYLISHVRSYISDSMTTAFKEAHSEPRFAVPEEIAAKVYSAAVLIVLEWRILDKKECSLEQAKAILRQTVSGIELRS